MTNFISSWKQIVQLEMGFNFLPFRYDAELERIWEKHCTIDGAGKMRINGSQCSTVLVVVFFVGKLLLYQGRDSEFQRMFKINVKTNIWQSRVVQWGKTETLQLKNILYMYVPRQVFVRRLQYHRKFEIMCNFVWEKPCNGFCNVNISFYNADSMRVKATTTTQREMKCSPRSLRMG